MGDEASSTDVKHGCRFYCVEGLQMFEEAYGGIPQTKV